MKKLDILLLVFAFADEDAIYLFNSSLALFTEFISSFEKLSILNKIGRMSSFSFVVCGSFDKN